MTMLHRQPLVAGLLLALSTSLTAGTEPLFTPLTQSAAVTLPNSDEELTAPWTVPAGVTQEMLTSMEEAEADAAQSHNVCDEETGPNLLEACIEGFPA